MVTNNFSDGIDIAPYQAIDRIVQGEGLQKEGACSSSLRGLFQFQNV